MGILRNGATPTKIMRGAAAVTRVYRGTSMVWPYPASGEWGPLAITTTQTTYDSHTFIEAGSYTITHTAYGDNSNLRARINWGAGEYALGSDYLDGSVTASVTRSFAAGAVVDFAAFHTSGSGTARGTWRIVKN